ncbi:MAG: hypothetical protein DWQ35_00345 [Planctomycetota bacterium]|nr:MAG: hypothetical protein DWQ35_00345 [Planctomycetota bacterium]
MTVPERAAHLVGLVARVVTAGDGWDLAAAAARRAERHLTELSLDSLRVGRRWPESALFHALDVDSAAEDVLVALENAGCRALDGRPRRVVRRMVASVLAEHLERAWLRG